MEPPFNSWELSFYKLGSRFCAKRIIHNMSILAWKGKVKMDNTLQHHGILGQRWGVRRYQNKDGTLTKAGKKRAAELKEEYTQITGKRLIRKPGTAKAEKTISEMTNKEIQDKIERIRLEQTLSSLTKNPEKISKSRKFISSLTNDVIAPAAKNIGRQWLEKQLKESLGLKEEKSNLQKLRDKSEEARLKKEIADYEQQRKSISEQDGPSLKTMQDYNKYKATKDLYEKNKEAEKKKKSQ